MNGSNDPLDPAYQHDPGKVRPVKRLGRLGSRTNMPVLIVILVALLALVYFLARPSDTPTDKAPAEMEVR